MDKKASVGRIVRVVGTVAQSNGADEAAAIVTRVWSRDDAKGAWMVNLTVFPDWNAPNHTASSVYLFDNEAAAREFAAPAGATAAFWPSLT